MLSQSEADNLIQLVKYLQQYDEVSIPSFGQKIQLNAQSDDSNEFLIDIRRGSINVFQATFQTRYQKNFPLIRLDLEGPEHQNPNGEVVPCPHLHIYKEGYDLKYAYPVDLKSDPNFSNLSSLVEVLIDYLEYNNVINIPTRIIDSLL